MAMLRFLFYLLVMLVFIIAGLIFSFRNNTLINVDLIVLQIPSLSIGIWLLLSLILGVILGIILAFPKSVSQSLKIHKLSKKLPESSLSATRGISESNKG